MMMSDTPDAGPPPNGCLLTPSPNTQPIFMHGVLPKDDHMNILYDTLIHIDIHHSSNAVTNYPIKPFICDFLQALQNVNNQNSILLIDLTSSLGCITMEMTSLLVINSPSMLMVSVSQ